MPFNAFSYAQVSEHRSKSDLWIIIGNKVHDVTSFVTEHPGGEEVLLSEAGQDGTDSFENVGHSSEARELLKSFVIGELSSMPGKKQKGFKQLHNTEVAVDRSFTNARYIIIFVLIVIGFAIFKSSS